MNCVPMFLHWGSSQDFDWPFRNPHFVSVELFRMGLAFLFVCMFPIIVLLQNPTVLYLPSWSFNERTFFQDFLLVILAMLVWCILLALSQLEQERKTNIMNKLNVFQKNALSTHQSTEHFHQKIILVIFFFFLGTMWDRPLGLFFTLQISHWHHFVSFL